METILIATYSQVGHPQFQEDTWKSTRTISNENELYNWMKDIHKTSARSFSDYPYGGLYNHKNISFEKQTIFINDGEVFKGKKTKCEKPDYFDAAAARFDEWLKNLKIRLPLLEKAHEARLVEERELAQYEYLKLKYNK